MNLYTELHERRLNTEKLFLLQQRICPACGEEAIKLVAENSWECFKCHAHFSANYDSTPRHTKKPVAYKD